MTFHYFDKDHLREAIGMVTPEEHIVLQKVILEKQTMNDVLFNSILAGLGC